MSAHERQWAWVAILAAIGFAVAGASCGGTVDSVPSAGTGSGGAQASSSASSGSGGATIAEDAAAICKAGAAQNCAEELDPKCAASFEENYQVLGVCAPPWKLYIDCLAQHPEAFVNQCNPMPMACLALVTTFENCQTTKGSAASG